MNIGEHFFEEPLINIHECLKQHDLRGYYKYRKNLDVIKQFDKEMSGMRWCFPHRVQYTNQLVDDTSGLYKLSEYKFWHSSEDLIGFTNEVEEHLK